MDRRELLKMIALLTGASVIGGEVFLSGCKTAPKTGAGFTASNISLLDEVGETIIPATSSPGAKAAQIGEFMKVMVTDCYTQKEQDAFMNGIVQLEEICKEKYDKSFIECTPQQRHEFLISLEKEAKAANLKRDEEEKPLKEAHEQKTNTISWKDQKTFESAPNHYYTMMKQLTLLGFFTSKTGMTQTLRHIAVPSKYDGEFPYKQGDKAWAE